MNHADNNMGNIGFRRQGFGPRKVLALGGWFGHADDWGAMADGLDLEEFTFVFADYRGYGRSRNLTGDYTFTEVAADVERLVDHLEWDRFSLLGHSMGGSAVQRVLLAMPQRIDRLVGISAVPACSSRMDAQRIAMFEEAVTDIARREFIIDFSTGRRLPKTWVAGMARQSWVQSTQEAFAGYLKEWAGNDFSALVQDNLTPVKLIVGEYDPTLTADLMQRTWMAWYPNAELEILANCGHYAMNEVPLALAASVQAFLKPD